ncbi:tyrosine-type recombinase/integrase [bacterium]|nr:tyrosine-type recombinase/integrase [bacterium]
MIDLSETGRLLPLSHMGEDSLQHIREAFQKYLAEQGKHQNTIRSYANDLKQFMQWSRSSFGDQFMLAELTRSDIQDYRTFLLTRNSSPASVNRKITALRQFFEYCVVQSLMQRNPAAEISGISAEPRAPTVLQRKDALLLARTAERNPGPLEGAVILLLLHSGLRSSELCGMTVGDVHLTPREGRVFIKGQRGKTTRFVYLSTRAQNALRQFMRWRGVSVMAKRLRKEPLFITYEGNPLTQQAVDQLVKRVGKTAGLPDITPSMLRNTYAANALQSGKSLDSLARAMGVSSIKTLQKLKEELDDEQEN